MIKDYRLIVPLEENQQLSLDFARLAHDMEVLARALRGSIWSVSPHGLFVIWEFSAYQPDRHVRERLKRMLPPGLRWVLASRNRVEYGNLTRKEVGLLLDFTDHAARRSA